MKNSIVIMSVLAVVLGITIISSSYAYAVTPASKGVNYSPERETQMTEIMAKGDYSAWKELMGGRGRASQVVTEANFPKFVEAWKLNQSGKTTEARALRSELGLNGRGQGAGGCSGGCGMNGASKGQGARQGFIDANNNGVCDRRE